MVYVPPAYIDKPFYQMAWELLRWFDYWLKGIDTGIMDEPNVRIFVPGSNEWLNAADFPIPHTRWIPFNLHQNRSLCEIEPWPEAESASYDDAPRNRGNLKYYSAPFVENTEMVGLSSLNVYASCRGTDMNLFTSLWAADKEGKESCLCRGYLKASHRELDPESSKPWHPVTVDKNPQTGNTRTDLQAGDRLFAVSLLLQGGTKIGAEDKQCGRRSGESVSGRDGPFMQPDPQYHHYLS